MKKRIIIESDFANPCVYVQKVIDAGFVSSNGTCYCHITIFRDNTHVSCDKIKTGFKFNVWRS